MTGPEAGALFIGYKSHWFCIPPGPEVPKVITRGERNEHHTVRRIYGWTTKLLRD